jgi:ABC-type multidrug transport system ATPase subunit
MKERISGDQTVVFVSHSDAQVQALCDRAIWIDGGRIMSEGDTAGVLQEYKAFINGGHVADIGLKQDYKPAFTDRRLEKMQIKLELSDEQVAEMRKIRDQGGSRKDIRAVLDEEQQQQLKNAKRRRNRRRNKNKSQKREKAPGSRST